MDLYDDVIAAPATTNSAENSENNHQTASTATPEETNGNTYSTQGNNITPNVGRRHQLYVGNLTWVSKLTIYFTINAYSPPGKDNNVFFETGPSIFDLGSITTFYKVFKNL